MALLSVQDDASGRELRAEAAAATAPEFADAKWTELAKDLEPPRLLVSSLYRLCLFSPFVVSLIIYSGITSADALRFSGEFSEKSN